jgi:thiamine-phosphate pyrophosphorylase
MRPLAERLRLTLVTDPDAGPGRTVVEVVRAALRAGVPAVQLRAKEASARELMEMAGVLGAAAREAGALFVINDRVDVAIASGADGAHIGGDDVPVAAVRRIVGRGFIIGASAATPAAARQAAAAGADYVGAGPVYATGSKGDAGEPVGTERIAEVVAAVGVPVVGIGGIDAATAGSVVRAGAAGVAVISALMRAPDPEAAARALLRAVGAGDPPTARPGSAG